MSDRIGPLFYGSDGEIFVGRSYQQEKGYSEEIANTIDEEVRSIVDGCHKRATEILTQKMDVLHNMARILIEKETIHTDEVNMLMQGKSADDVIAFMAVAQVLQPRGADYRHARGAACQGASHAERARLFRFGGGRENGAAEAVKANAETVTAEPKNNSEAVTEEKAEQTVRETETAAEEPKEEKPAKKTKKKKDE